MPKNPVLPVFRSKKAMNDALASGVTDMIGMGRPLAVEPDFPEKLLNHDEYASAVNRPSTGIAILDYASMLDLTWYEMQLYRMGKGLPPDPDLGAWRSVFQTFWRLGAHAFTKRRASSKKTRR